MWYGSAILHNKNMLEGIVKVASNITGCGLPSIESICATHILRKATTIISDPSHPANHLFDLHPSGKRFRSVRTRTIRFSNRFYPKAVQTMSFYTESKPCHFTQSPKNNKSSLLFFYYSYRYHSVLLPPLLISDTDAR